MKRFIVIAFVFASLVVRSQIGYEQFYSEKQLLAMLHQAKTSGDRLEAYGLLAKHYNQIFNDSLAKAYLERLRSVYMDTKDVKLKARGLWWDNYYEPQTIRAQQYIDWANENNLIDDKIAGYVELTRVNIHINYFRLNRIF